MSNYIGTKIENCHNLKITVSSPGASEGEMCKEDDTIGMWLNDYDTGDPGVLIIESERISLPKAAVAIDEGQFIYFDATLLTVTDVSASGLFRCGICKEDAAAGDARVLVDFWGHDPIEIP